MSVASFNRVDLVERQAAFTGLLAHPLVSPVNHPTLYALVHRHEHTIDLWSARLGYRLVRIDQSYRLRRLPIDGRVAVPRGTPPARRPLVLSLLIAAILEDHRQDSITLQEISDDVRQFAAANHFVAYDPEHRSHRVALLAGVRLLVTHGVLDQRTSRGELLDDWERTGGGIGAGYLIQRTSLVLLVDARDVQLALDPPDDGADARGHRLLRVLVETQALHPLELDETDRSYLASQRRRLVDQAEEMTGGTVEQRSDAWVLVLPSDQGIDPALTVDFPEANAADWVALALLDATGRASTRQPDGHQHCPAATVAAVATELHAEQGDRLTRALRESADAVRSTAEDQLQAAGLLIVDDLGDWHLLPEAGRFRSADLQLPRAVTEEPVALFEENA